MIGFCAYCGTGFTDQDLRCSYCNAAIPETSGHILIPSSSPMQPKQRDKLQDASLGLNGLRQVTCRRKWKSFFAMIFDTSLLEYVIS